MTTSTVAADPEQAERALRLVPVTANLLPTEVVDSRRARKVRRLVISALAAFTAVLAAWYGVAGYQTTSAQTALERTESDAAKVLRQQRAFDDVVRAQAETTAINNQLGALFAGDLPWSTLFAAVQSRAAAHGIGLTNLNGVLTPAAGPGPVASAAPGPTGASSSTAIGSVTVSGVGRSKAAVADFVDALATVTGLTDLLLSDVSSLDGKVQFTMRATITSATVGGRFTAGAPASVSPAPATGSNQAGGN